MADIYRNAMLTIAAASPDSVQGGFHYRRPNWFIWPQVSMCFLSTRFPDAKGHYSIRRESPCINPLGDLDTSRWSIRGWVFQEQHLSGRLIIGPTMVRFHCRDWSLRGNCVALFELFLADAPSFRRHNHSSYSHAHTNKYAVWYELMERYSSRDLTYVDDRLPSIQGIAKEIRACLHGLNIEDEHAARL